MKPWGCHLQLMYDQRELKEYEQKKARAFMVVLHANGSSYAFAVAAGAVGLIQRHARPTRNIFDLALFFDCKNIGSYK